MANSDLFIVFFLSKAQLAVVTEVFESSCRQRFLKRRITKEKIIRGKLIAVVHVNRSRTWICAGRCESFGKEKSSTASLLASALLVIWLLVEKLSVPGASDITTLSARADHPQIPANNISSIQPRTETVAERVLVSLKQYTCRWNALRSAGALSIYV